MFTPGLPHRPGLTAPSCGTKCFNSSLYLFITDQRCLGRKAFVVISSRFADIFSDFRRFYQFYKHLHKFNTSCFCSGPLSLRMDAETHRPAAG